MASNVYAFFGSRGMYCYDMEGNLIWKKDFGVQMHMRMSFGEGMAPVVSGDRLILVFDSERGFLHGCPRQEFGEGNLACGSR